MGEITGLQWQNFLTVALAIGAAVVLLGNVTKAIREWRKPSNDLQEWKRDVDDKLGNDNERLKAMENGTNVLCRGMLALLSHEINGNSTDKLKASQEEITDYLIER